MPSVIDRQKSATVLIADDYAVVRAGVRYILDGLPSVRIVAETSDAANVCPLAALHQPNLVILDAIMCKGIGITLLPELKQKVPNCRLLILSVCDDPECVQQCIQAGACGYVLKKADPSDLRSAVTSVLAGRQYFSADLERREGPRVVTLVTARERQILALIVSGKTNKQMAAQLGISPRTVETHRESVMRKTGVSSVAELTRYAIENGTLEFT